MRRWEASLGSYSGRARARRAARFGAVAVITIALAGVMPSPVVAQAQSRVATLPDARPVPASAPDLGRDIASLRTRTTLTYRAQHGSFETHVYAESVNYRDETGAWRRIDNTLRPRGAVVTNGANRYTMTLPEKLESGAVRVADGSTWVVFEPRGVRPAPVETAGSQASFRNAWPGVRLEYTATGDTVKEALVVHGPAYVRDSCSTCVSHRVSRRSRSTPARSCCMIARASRR